MITRHHNEVPTKIENVNQLCIKQNPNVIIQYYQAFELTEYQIWSEYGSIINNSHHMVYMLPTAMWSPGIVSRAGSKRASRSFPDRRGKMWSVWFYYRDLSDHKFWLLRDQCENQEFWPAIYLYIWSSVWSPLHMIICIPGDHIKWS